MRNTLSASSTTCGPSPSRTSVNRRRKRSSDRVGAVGRRVELIEGRSSRNRHDGQAGRDRLQPSGGLAILALVTRPCPTIDRERNSLTSLSECSRFRCPVFVTKEHAMDPLLGTIQLFAFNFVPKGWLPCDGALLQINQNTAVFSLV